MASFVYDDGKPAGRGIVYDEPEPTTKEKPKSSAPRGFLSTLGEAASQFGRVTGMSPILEPLLAMGSGIAGKAAGDVAGMGAIPLHAAGATQTEPKDVQASVRESMSYAPRDPAAQAILKLLGLPGEAIGYAARKAGEAMAPPTAGPLRAALGSGMTEAIEQSPAFLGLKTPAGAASLSRSMESGAKRTMQSALKPSVKALETGKAEKAIQTMLDEGINVSKGGVEKMGGMVDDLNSRIAKAIANSPASIDKVAVAKRLLDPYRKFMKQVNSLDDVAAIQGAFQEFMNHPLLAGKDIPVQLAQEMKQGTYRALKDKAYTGEMKSASIEAQKALARGLKEEIAAAVPEVRALNAQESRLLTALPMVERRVMVAANKNPIGLGWLAKNPTHLAAWMADRSELFKSLVARMLHAGSKNVPSMALAGPIGGMYQTTVADEPAR